MAHVWIRKETHTGILWGNLKERAHLEDLYVEERIILKWILWKCDGEALTGLLWLRIGTIGGLF